MSELHERWRAEHTNVYGVPTHKGCTHCRRQLLIEEFRVLPAKSRWRELTLDSWCRDCRREAVRAWRAANRDRIAAARAKRRVPPVRLKCVECGSEFEGRSDRLLCGRAYCREKRFARFHPAQHKEKQRLKAARRRARRRGEA